MGPGAQGEVGAGSGAQAFDGEVKPLVGNYCLKCHSTAKQKGHIDLEQFGSLADALKRPKVWEQALRRLVNSEMPPEDEAQPTPPERQRLVDGVNALLDEAARARGADPGPVLLRRLNNAEYTYSVRDLTGLESLEPAKEFPADSASGEGFMNVGNSLVMSPALVTKYLEAAKETVRHVVLLPDGIAFSPGASPRDWADEKMAAIRAFYARFTENGAGSSVNLQGIKFDTKDGGVLPLEKYFEAALADRDTLQAGRKSLAEVAREHGLNAKYLGLLWNALNDPAPSLLLDRVRAQWHAAKLGKPAPLLAGIHQWQQALWRFTSVGHIGKRDGPKAWQVPVTPLAAAREVRLKIPTPTLGNEVTLYLVTSDAGDGSEHDFAVWDNPRLVAPGRPDLPLRGVRGAVNALMAYREKVSAAAAECLAAAAEAVGSPGQDAIERLAQQHGVEPPLLMAWLDFLGIGTGPARIQAHMTRRLEQAGGYDFIKGWVGDDALSLLANSSDQHVRIPGNMKPHGIAVHPTPKLRVVVGWRSPAATTVRVEGAVQHAHVECGNGVEWVLELRRGGSRLRLAAGVAQDATEFKLGPFDPLAVQPGDVVCVSVGPRDGNHACDLTAIDLNLRDGTRQWDLAKDVSPNILAGNPHADSLGNAEVWHFYSEPDNATGAQPVHLDAVLKFAESAYRRPLTKQEKDELRGLYRKLRDQDIPHDQAIRLALARTLIAPAFLYRAEEAPPGDHPATVDDWALATRLSYFLWSSVPDTQLRAAAASGKLRDPEVLVAQTRRMLQDPRARRLATEFACAWLQIYDFQSLDEKSDRHFPTFARLRGPMYEEAIRFFTDLFQNGRSVLSILDADYAFLNGPLAEHYAIPGVAGAEWRRVEGVRKYGRGGVLGLGATLAKMSGASRTSPILRGNWVGEVLLGDRLPPPPKDVPKLPEDEAAETLTVRQLIEKHSTDPRCAVCHLHIDGYGFALEGFDAIGRLRSKDLGGRPVETRAKVFDGTVVEDAQGLRDYLLTKKRAAVLQQFDRKLLGYALGRAVGLTDRPLLAEMRRQLEARNYEVNAAVEAVVLSRQFREIRGRETTLED